MSKQCKELNLKDFQKTSKEDYFDCEIMQSNAKLVLKLLNCVPVNLFDK